MNDPNLNRHNQLQKTYHFNEVTAVVTPTSKHHGLVICLPNDKAPVGVQTQPINMTVEQCRSVIDGGQWNVGHAITTRQIDVDFDTYNSNVIAAFDYFLPKTPYRLGRKNKPDSHWIYNLNEDFYEVAPVYKHIINFLARDFKVLGKTVKVEYRYRTHKDNEFTSRFAAENPYVFAPGSTHTSGELIEWQDTFKENLTAVHFDTQYLFKQSVLAAIAAMIVPHWIEGSRQYMAMALAGALQRMASVRPVEGDNKGVKFSDLDFETLIKGICELAGDREIGVRLHTFKQTWSKGRDPGIKTTGANTLSRYLGQDAAYIIKSMYDLITGIYSEVNIQELVERYFIEIGQGRIIDSHKISGRTTWRMTREEFTNSYAAHSVIWRGKRVPLSKFCYEYGALNYIDGVDSFPPEKLTIEDYYRSDSDKFHQDGNKLYLNIWHMYEIAPFIDTVNEAEVNPFITYIKDVIGTTPEKYAYIMAWLANIIQSPAHKPRTYPIIVGEQGAGKSFLFEQFIIPIMGRINTVTETNMEQVLVGFNSILEGKTLTLFEEAINHNKREVANMLKHYITGKTMPLRKKHHADREVNNFARAVFLSNDIEQAVAIDATIGERRASVFMVDPAYVGNKQYWDDLAKWARDNLDKVHRYLLDYRYDLSILDTALHTDEKANMQSHSLMYEQPEIAWILERLEEGYPLDMGKPRKWFDAYHSEDEKELAEGLLIDSSKWPNRVSEAALRKDLQDWANSNGVPRHKTLGLKKRIHKCFPFLRQMHRSKIDLIEGGKSTTISPILSEFPNRNEILAHLKPKYGHVFSEALKRNELDKLKIKDLSRKARMNI